MRSDTVEEALMGLARQFAEKRYGKYRGFVADNRDPEKRARLKLRVPSVLGTAVTNWAKPCLPFGGGASYGWFAVPEKDAQVWVEFEEGDIDQPIWVGTFWQSGKDVPKGADASPPTTRVFATPSDLRLQFDDAKGQEKITLIHSKKKASLVIDENGTMTLDSKGTKLILDTAGKLRLEASNNKVTLDANGITIEGAGNKIEMNAAGIKLTGSSIVLNGTVMLGGEGGVPIIKGSSFLSLYASHTHLASSGPTGPPLPLGETSTLSTKVTTG